MIARDANYTYIDGINVSNFLRKDILNSPSSFVGISFGTQGDMAYVYSEGSNINFRYKDQNGAVQYTNIRSIIADIGSRAWASHNHDSAYLKLSGGTITGSLTIKNTAYCPILHSGNNNCDLFGNVTGRMYLHNDGEVIFTTRPSAHLSETSQVLKVANWPRSSSPLSSCLYLPYGSGTINVTTSDKRLKVNITDSDVNGLEFIRNIHFRQFDWNNRKKNIHQKLGVIADEIELYDENFICGGGGLNDDGSVNPKCIDTLTLMSYIGKALQELDQNVQKFCETKSI